MNKNLRLNFLLVMALACVMIAWGTLTNFFSGVGVNFVAMLIVTGVLAYFVFTDKYIKSRMLDIFILTSIFTFLEFIVYIVFEFGTDSVKVFDFFLGFQHFLSVMGILFLAYTAFRFALEYKDIKLGFIETILGNSRREKKVKANKELVNGSLEEKPNHKAQETEPTDDTVEVTSEHDVVIVEAEQSEE